MNDIEHQIQVSCVRWFRYKFPHCLLYAIPNGSKRNVIVASKLKSEGVTAGVPDLFVAEPKGIWHGLYVEMKNGKKGVISENQKKIMRALSIKGYKCIVCRSFDDFMKFVDEYMSS